MPFCPVFPYLSGGLDLKYVWGYKGLLAITHMAGSESKFDEGSQEAIVRAIVIFK